MVYHLAGVCFGLQNNYIIVQTSDYNFLCEQKAHVMIPHNSNTTKRPGYSPYIILQVYSLMGVETIFCIGFWSNSLLPVEV